MPSRNELLRIVTEHLVVVALLLAGLVAGAFLRDVRADKLPGLLEVAEWIDPGAAARHLTSFLIRLERFRPQLPGHLAWDFVAAAALQYSMYLHGLYDRQPIRRARNRLLRLLRSAVVAGIVLSVVFFLVRPPELGRTALFIGYALSVLTIWAARTTRQVFVPPRAETLLLLGEGPACREVLEAARSVTLPGYRVAGRVGPPNGDDPEIPRLGDWNDVQSVLDREPIDRTLLASPPPERWNMGVLVAARLDGIGVASARSFAENLTGEVPADDPGVEFLLDGTATAYGAVSRLADAVLSAALLVLLSPVMVAVAAAVLATSGRPVLFSQKRIGLAGRPYTCWKFRSMRRGADREGAAWSPDGDPRVTPLGRVLRRWRLDELPQLFNVLRGDMAFVGPRPEQPFFVERLAERLPHYSLRHLVRPGLTGWAQVRHPYGSSEEDAKRKLRYDLFYVKHRSPYLDLAILFDTVRVVLRGTGR